MASPQKEDGYTAIANEIMDALCKIRIPGEERQVLDVIFRKTYGYNKCEDHIALSQFADATGIKKPNIIGAIKGLLSKKIIIVIEKDNAYGKVYKFNKNYDEWVPLSKKITFLDGSRTITIEDIQANIRKRDNNKCFICGHSDRMLPVHHIDYNQGNNDESNLVTLCITCHARTNSNYDYWKDELSKKIIDYLLSKKIISVIQKDNPSLSKKIPTKDNTTKDNITKTKVSFILPDFISSETWEAFREMRTKVKAPLTVHASNLIISKLIALQKENIRNKPEDVLNQSVMNGWKGVFELKDGGNGNGNKSINAYSNRAINPRAVSDETERELERIAAQYEVNKAEYAKKQAAARKAQGNAQADDVPDFRS